MSISKQKMLSLRTQDSTGLNKFQLWNKLLFQLMKVIKKDERKGPKEQEQQTNRFNWVESLRIWLNTPTPLSITDYFYFFLTLFSEYFSRIYLHQNY